MSVLLPAVSRSASLIRADTLQAVFERISDAMDGCSTLFAHARDDDRRCEVLGYGVMRDGSTYVTLHDPCVTAEAGIVILDFAAFARAFDRIRGPTHAEEAALERQSI